MFHLFPVRYQYHQFSTALICALLFLAEANWLFALELVGKPGEHRYSEVMLNIRFTLVRVPIGQQSYFCRKPSSAERDVLEKVAIEAYLAGSARHFSRFQTVLSMGYS